MSGLKKLIISSDFYGSYLSFEENENQKYKSVIGGIVSIGTVVVIAVLGLLFSKDFFNRQNPSVTLSKQKLEESKVSISDLGLLLTFNTPDGIEVKDPLSYISFSIRRVDIYANNTNNYLEKQNFSIEKCNITALKTGKFSQIYKDIDLSTMIYFCPKENSNLYFKNGFTVLDSSFIEIAVDKCNNLTYNCAANMSTVLEDSYISVRYIDSYVDYYNLTNPIQYDFAAYTQRVSYSIKSQSLLSFTNNGLYSYEGIILDSFKSYTYISSVSKQITNFYGTSGPFYYLRFDSPTIRDLSFRKYLTIQDIFAKIGGFANAVYIIVYVLTYHYLRFKYYFHIKNLLESEFDYADIDPTSKIIYKIMESCHHERKYSFPKPDETKIKDFGKNNLIKRESKLQSIKENIKIQKQISKQNIPEVKCVESDEVFQQNQPEALAEPEPVVQNQYNEEIQDQIKQKNYTIDRIQKIHKETMSTIGIEEDMFTNPSFLDFMLTKICQKKNNAYKELINLVNVTLSFKNVIKHVHYINSN